MKQIIQNYRTGEVKLREVPVPICSSNKVLVKNEASVISVGTERSIIELGKMSLLGKAKSRPDLVKRFKEKAQNEGLLKTLKEAFGRLDVPTALGYSSAGIVKEVGNNVHKFSPGDKVACMGAGYAAHAEYITVPENLCCKIPEGLSYEEAAFGTLGSIAIHSIRKAKVQFGERVAVIGLGLLGLLTTQILKAYGCKVMGMDTDSYKVKLAKKIGIDLAFSSLKDFKNSVEKFTDSYGVDAVIIAASTQSDEPLHLAVDTAKYGARIVVLGVADIHPLRNEIWQKELEVLVSKGGGPGLFDPLYEEKNIDYPFGYVRWTENRNLEEFLRLAAEKKINLKEFISHKFEIEQAEKVYQNLLGNKLGQCIGAIFTYPKDEEADSVQLLRIVKNPDYKIKPVEKIVLGVVGAGVFGKALLLPALKSIKNIKLHTLVTSSSANVEHTGKKYGFEYFASDYKEILSNPDINTVLILTPHELHSKMFIEALKAGKNVFVEKPLCVNKEELNEIIAVYDSLVLDSKPLAMVGYNRRFSPHTAKIKKFLEERKDPLIIHYRVNVGFVSEAHWVHSEEQGGSRIVGEVCHFIDFMQYLTGSKPVKVYAERISGNNKTAMNSDNVLIIIKFEDGSIGNIVYTASGDRAFSREHCEVFCEAKTAVLENFKKTSFYDKGSKKFFETFNQELGHKEELLNFFSAIKGETRLQITPEEFFCSTLTIFKIIESLSKGKPEII